MAVENYLSKQNASEVFAKIETKLQNRYTKAQVDSAIASAISGITEFDYQLVTEENPLPAEGKKGVIYLVSNEGEGTNLYNEFIWIVIDGTGKYENLGMKELDISNLLKNQDVKVNTTNLSKTNDEEGNGMTLDLSETAKTSLGKADTALQPDDIEPLSAEDVNELKAIFTDDPTAQSGD